MTLQEVYDSLPANKQARAREQIMKLCDFNKNTFYRKIRGESRVYEPEKKIFARYFGIPAEDLFPVKKVNASPRMKKPIAHE